ncbi:chaperone protein dnaJ 8, chloroplastic [Artemisia annua]|uniref:Chaperone protein dnaJ 8, chloroplastic n=1 Tax=Artemisia annua TaxID=35608 RepID=A0A2U1PDY0_ARTAN|nr:chaperone protein dnaJ 8, chloroplastic [Artemisia annua]
MCAKHVKKAFRELASKYHPDVCRGSDCGVQFHQINEPYDVTANDETTEERQKELDKLTSLKAFTMYLTFINMGVARKKRQTFLLLTVTRTSVPIKLPNVSMILYHNHRVSKSLDFHVVVVVFKVVICKPSLIVPRAILHIVHKTT